MPPIKPRRHSCAEADLARLEMIGERQEQLDAGKLGTDERSCSGRSPHRMAIPNFSATELRDVHKLATHADASSG